MAQTPSSGAGASYEEGVFDSIIFDFRDTPDVTGQIDALVKQVKEMEGFDFKLFPNSEFSEVDHILITPGDRNLLNLFRNSDIAAYTEYIEPNYIYSQAGVSVNDPDYDKQWNLKQINVEGAWSKGATGKGATVAVIDTGISQGPDLKQTQFVPGYDFVNDRKDARDDNGHGTHVAGTIAQSTNNNYGVAGVAYGAKLMPLKVLSRGGSGTVSDIAEAIRFAADNGADVINMSLGGGGRSKLMEEAINYAHKKGVTIIAAAGNEGRSSASYPALYDNVVAVSAVGPDKQKTSYSNYGTGVNIAAPGGATRSSELNGILQETINPRVLGEFQFKYFQGTSMASPHVAGVAALIKSRRPNWSPNQVWEVLKTSAVPVKDDSRNYYGAGYLDAQRAIAKTGGGWPIGFNPGPIAWKMMALKLFLAACLTWLLMPRRSRVSPWNFNFVLGVILGSIGLFFFQWIEISFLPSWPLQLLGSAVPEMGGAIWNPELLNPIFASFLIPFGLMSLLISYRGLKWLTLGIAIGVITYLGVAALSSPEMWLLGSGRVAQSFLVGNALVGSVLTALFLRVAVDDESA